MSVFSLLGTVHTENKYLPTYIYLGRYFGAVQLLVQESTCMPIREALYLLEVFFGYGHRIQQRMAFSVSQWTF